MKWLLKRPALLIYIHSASKAMLSFPLKLFNLKREGDVLIFSGAADLDYSFFFVCDVVGMI